MAVQDVMRTCIPIHVYEFSWTIENFSVSPNTLQGPYAASIPGFQEKLYFELHFYQKQLIGKVQHTLYLALKGSSSVDSQLSVSSSTTFRNTNDEILKMAKTPNTKYNGNITLLESIYVLPTASACKLELSKAMNLKDDKLVVKGTLSFSGYTINSSVFSSFKDNSKTCGSLLEDMKTMYKNGTSSDITFSVGEETLSAHKIILAMRSPVFAKMFNNDMLEKSSKKVVIKDSDSHVFNCFLIFLYTGILEDKKWDTVFSLYHLAHKYEVKSLFETSSGLLVGSLTTNNACSILMLADLHGDMKLKEATKVFIRCQLCSVVGTSEWAEMVISKAHLVKEVLNFAAETNRK